MASVNWYKMTMQTAAGMSRHLGKSRGLLNHSNKDIDSSRTHLNTIIGAESYQAAYRAMRDRTREVDKVLPPKRKRQDRKVAVMLEYPCPAPLTARGLDTRFFDEAHKLITAFVGAENVHGSFIHRDEQHAYNDYRTGERRESLYHAHTLVSCYVEGKGINGKAFCKRSQLVKLNNAMQDMVAREFGISYNTGEGRHGEAVELMKAETARRDAEAVLAASERALEALKMSLQALERPQAPLPRHETVKRSRGLMRGSDELYAYSPEDARRLEQGYQYGVTVGEVQTVIKQLEERVQQLTQDPQTIALAELAMRRAAELSSWERKLMDIYKRDAERYQALQAALPAESMATLDRLIDAQEAGLIIGFNDKEERG